MATRRLLILQELLTRVQQITVANGFATDAGAAVFMGEVLQLGESDPDVVLALVAGDDLVRSQQVNIAVTLPVEIQAVARADLAQPWVAVETVLGDIKRAMELPDRTLGGLVRQQVLRSVTRTLPREPGTLTVGVGVTYVLPYIEEWGAP
jgi:hypothetical protein